MSREQYQPPATGGNEQASGGASTSNFEANPVTVMHYICGDCAHRVRLEKGQPIRCGLCGARVLYKERTKRQAARARQKWYIDLIVTDTYCASQNGSIRGALADEPYPATQRERNWISRSLDKVNPRARSNNTSRIDRTLDGPDDTSIVAEWYSMGDLEWKGKRS